MSHLNLKQLGFSDEFRITKDPRSNMELVLSTPIKSGVYILHASNEINRLEGSSSIVYIGRSGNLRLRLKYLLKNYLPPEFARNWGRHTAREALGRILEETKILLSISYCICGNYKELETKLLQSYCKQHIEGPPLNNQRK